jgi:geranylgeranyl diphosphate synthase type II
LDLTDYLSKKRAVVDLALQSNFPDPSGLLFDIIKAMKYSIFAGGKRLRPILCIAGSEAVGGSDEDVINVACALELIHTFSLIHDDLPMMDDDDTRRGMPTSHKLFGEAVALLAGDGLLIEAFGMIASTGVSKFASPAKLLEVISLISHAAGHRGMIGGQVADIKYEGKTADISVVEFIHTHKTGALISSSVVSGAILGGGSSAQIKAIKSYGEKIGLAFQISDDILDIEGDSKLMGKKAGVDSQREKTTYPSVVGLGKSRAIQDNLVSSAVEVLKGFDHRADPLREIAMYIINRKN